MKEEIRSGAEVLPPRPLTFAEKAARLAAMTEEEKRGMRCCFAALTLRELRRPVDDIKVDLENEILRAVRDGYRTFLIGLTPGTDVWAGNIVIRLKDRFPELKLIAAVPFPGPAGDQEAEWAEKAERLLSRADLVKTIRPEGAEETCPRLQAWMVDHSSRLIAVYSGPSGSAGGMVRYARKIRVPVKYLPA